ncbi:hypothetical protein C8T65DRAFT_708591 [Cerioporus squamosus]|nr:hypothetical protein C8T65DRAFT_708591 [Cerioporus squamosus]
MAYDYYRSSVPGWGTSQFQFGAPPMPAFQPQPSWTGYDFYNCTRTEPRPVSSRNLYNSVMSRMGSFSGLGVDHRTARHWHSLIYSGVPLTQVLPADIGAAAAYEVYRTWKHNSSIYAPLSADRLMQREGLIGMAIAEATRLWQYSGRSMDAYGQRAACEAAAATAAILADQFTSLLGGGTTMFPPSPAMSPYLPTTSVPMSYAGSSPGYLGAGSAYGGSSPGYYGAGSAYGGYSPSGGSIAAPAGSTVVVTRPRHHSHERRGRSHSRDGHHHHHHHRGHSVEVLQTGGPGYGYQPYYGGGYGAGYAPGSSGYGGYGAYGGGYAPRYGYQSQYGPSGCVIC